MHNNCPKLRDAVQAYCKKGVFQQWLNHAPIDVAKDFWTLVKLEDAKSMARKAA